MCDSPISFFATPCGRRKPRHVISSRSDFDAAMQSLRSDADIWQSEHDAESGEDVRKLGTIQRHGDWNAVCGLIRKNNESLYMRGDCWHLALAIHRLHGLPMVAVIHHADKGSPTDPDPDQRPNRVCHVAAVLPDGRFLDIRGVLTDANALMKDVIHDGNYSVRPISADEIKKILKDYGILDDCSSYAVDDRADSFVRKTEIIVGVAFSEFIPAQHAMHRAAFEMVLACGPGGLAQLGDRDQAARALAHAREFAADLPAADPERMAFERLVTRMQDTSASEPMPTAPGRKPPYL